MRSFIGAMLLLPATLAGCSSAPACGPELRYCTKLRSGDVVFLSAEPLVAGVADTPGSSPCERVTLHVRRPSGRMMEMVIGWGIDCGELQVRTDLAQQRVWVVNATTKEVLASHLLLSASGAINEGGSSPLPANGGFVLVNSLTGSGSAAGPGAGVRGILAGPVSGGGRTT